MTAPDFIWIKPDAGFDGVAGTWLDEPDGLDMQRYVRRDPAVIAALPEVQAMLAAKLEDAAALPLNIIPYSPELKALLDAITAYRDAIRALITPDMAQALADRDARVRREALDSVTTLHHVLSMVREKSGLGAGPMLSDLPDAVAEKMEAARREERERAAGFAENFEWFECGAAFWPAAIAVAIRAEGGK